MLAFSLEDRFEVEEQKNGQATGDVNNQVKPVLDKRTGAKKSMQDNINFIGLRMG